ncbi:MAG: type I methionyl aminopeptidase [Acidimicrobiia bacterium]|nr:type I methionyl aminopeptidase [Acidimicrobiia bacterium]NNC74239.1 type I methionyl aminopeptidase [Acidimicrobiia bacterium]
MITVKSVEEFEKMAVAGSVVAAVHQAVREAAVPGVTLNRLDEISADIIRSAGCTPSFLGYMGYPKTICLSPNDVIVHGIPDDTVIRDGDVLSVDVGAIYEGWHGDAAFTMAIGDVPDEVSTLIDATEQAMWEGVAQARAGNRLGDVGSAVSAVAAPHGYGVVREYIGHGIGRQMHEKPEVPNYGEAGRGLKLKKGWAVCVEPMFNLGGAGTRVLDDGWSVVTADGSLSAHWEHTVAITKDGPMVLTLPEPKLIAVPA